METINHFPWTTSMMVFVVDKDGKILLKTKGDQLCGYRMDSTGKVNIREMVCDELYTCDILTCPENLQHQGILENNGKTVFIYTVNEFATNSRVPAINSSWYSKEEIPLHQLDEFDRQVLIMILDGEKIGF